MINIKYFLERVSDVKLSDIFSLIPMSIALIVKPLFKGRYKDVWLICEEPGEARDNGYHFFKYMREKQSKQKCIYAIKKSSVDYKKIECLGTVVEYGSIMHWIIYLLCQYNISSQKGGKPNAAICAFMELNGFFNTRNVFLQHGVTINDVKWLYAKKSKIDFFITATVPETAFIKETFGYPSATIKYLGFPRFDALHQTDLEKPQILIMPTWRYWFNLKSKQKDIDDIVFSESEYIKKWRELINSPELNNLIKNHGLKLVFYLHRNLQRFVNEFESENEDIIIASWKEYDVQTLLKESKVLVTDYSSVFFDMVYMKKPIVFYQFDYEKYRKYQYPEGYFSYSNNSFGKAFYKHVDVISELESIVTSDYTISDQYKKAHKEYFSLYDDKNSFRIYSVLADNLIDVAQ